MKKYLLFLLSCISFHLSAQTGDWDLVNSNLPTARHECSYVAVGSKFYLLGGRGNRPVQAYSPQANAWTTETSTMPMQLHHFQAVEYNGKVYVVGAFTGNCCHETPVPNI